MISSTCTHLGFAIAVIGHEIRLMQFLVSDAKRGQNLEAEARATRPRPRQRQRSRPISGGWGQGRGRK